MLFRSTWFLVKTANDQRLGLHEKLQVEVEELIHNMLAARRPGAKNVRVHQVWTQNINPQTIKVFFNYSFEETANEESVSQTISGHAILREIRHESYAIPTWTMADIATENSQMVFQNGIVITPQRGN